MINRCTPAAAAARNKFTLPSPRGWYLPPEAWPVAVLLKYIDHVGIRGDMALLWHARRDVYDMRFPQ